VNVGPEIRHRQPAQVQPPLGHPEQLLRLRHRLRPVHLLPRPPLVLLHPPRMFRPAPVVADMASHTLSWLSAMNASYSTACRMCGPAMSANRDSMSPIRSPRRDHVAVYPQCRT
jgi:hypothetical protein